MNKLRFLAIALMLTFSFSMHAIAQQDEMRNGVGAADVKIGESSSAVDQAKARSANTVAANSSTGNSVKASATHYESSRMSYVPEPEGWAMMLLGAGFVVFQVRRRRRARESWDLR